MSKHTDLPDKKDITTDLTTELSTNFKAALKDYLRSPLALLLTGIVLGALVVLGIRFATLKHEHVHYHANFALYSNGVRDPFKNFTYYEEVASCAGNDVSNPKIRVHMHSNISHVVHVHDNAVTWSHFFSNLGYTVGNDLIKTSDGVYINGQDDKKLQFVLNGETVQTIANRAIGDRDVLLISYGNEDDAAIKQQYNSIQSDAKHYDETADPAACSGDKTLNFTTRLKNTFELSK